MHVPVLLEETIRFLNPKAGQFIIDGTVDGGGHSKEIFKHITPGGILLGIDLDRNMLEVARKNILSSNFDLDTNLILVCGNYADLPEILKDKNLGKADGLLLDLGFSFWHIEESQRGFSFQKDEPLIMTYSSEGEGAVEFLNNADFKKIYTVIKTYGEERYAQEIAKKIIEERKKYKIETTGQLVKIIESAVPQSYFKRKIHPATKTFQALRIYLNKELENLEKVLQRLTDILKSGGRVVIISYHSLEDRLVKNYFKKMMIEEKIKILTKKIIRPRREEVQKNPKSRSAKLRSVQIL